MKPAFVIIVCVWYVAAVRVPPTWTNNRQPSGTQQQLGGFKSHHYGGPDDRHNDPKRQQQPTRYFQPVTDGLVLKESGKNQYGQRYRKPVKKMQMVKRANVQYTKLHYPTTKMQNLPTNMQNTPTKMQYVPNKMQNTPSKMQYVPSKIQNGASKMQHAATKIQHAASNAQFAPAKYLDRPVRGSYRYGQLVNASAVRSELSPHPPITYKQQRKPTLNQNGGRQKQFRPSVQLNEAPSWNTWNENSNEWIPKVASIAEQSSHEQLTSKQNPLQHTHDDKLSLQEISQEQFSLKQFPSRHQQFSTQQIPHQKFPIREPSHQQFPTQQTSNEHFPTQKTPYQQFSSQRFPHQQFHSQKTPRQQFPVNHESSTKREFHVPTIDTDESSELNEDIPTRPIYPGEGVWAVPGVKHHPYIKHEPLEKEVSQKDDNPIEGADVFEAGLTDFENKRVKFNVNSFPNENLVQSTTEPDESDEHNETEFVPTRLYTQVRKYEDEEHLPASVLEPRLRKIVKDSKIHTVYTEEGYEDAAYDHAGHEKAAEENEGYEEQDGNDAESAGSSYKSPDTNNFSETSLTKTTAMKENNSGNRQYEISSKMKIKVSPKKRPEIRYMKKLTKVGEPTVQMVDLKPEIDPDTAHLIMSDISQHFINKNLARKKRFVNDFPKIDVDTDFTLKFKPETVTTTTEKYPYYKDRGINKMSALRFAEDMKNIPVKSPGKMAFYEQANQMECKDVQSEVNPIPKKAEDKQSQDDDEDELDDNAKSQHDDDQDDDDVDETPKSPRLEKLGDKIDCFKMKYFGENPLDSPFFAEKTVEAPEPIFVELQKAVGSSKNAATSDEIASSASIQNLMKLLNADGRNIKQYNHKSGSNSENESYKESNDDLYFKNDNNSHNSGSAVLKNLALVKSNDKKSYKESKNYLNLKNNNNNHDIGSADLMNVELVKIDGKELLDKPFQIVTVTTNEPQEEFLKTTDKPLVMITTDAPQDEFFKTTDKPLQQFVTITTDEPQEDFEYYDELSQDADSKLEETIIKTTSSRQPKVSDLIFDLQTVNHTTTIGNPTNNTGLNITYDDLEDENLPQSLPLYLRRVRKRHPQHPNKFIPMYSMYRTSSTVRPKYNTISEVYYKDEIKPNEQLNVFADIINNIKNSTLYSQAEEIVDDKRGPNLFQNPTPQKYPKSNTRRSKIPVEKTKMKTVRGATNYLQTSTPRIVVVPMRKYPKNQAYENYMSNFKKQHPPITAQHDHTTTSTQKPKYKAKPKREPDVSNTKTAPEFQEPDYADEGTVIAGTPKQGYKNKQQPPSKYTTIDIPMNKYLVPGMKPPLSYEKPYIYSDFQLLSTNLLQRRNYHTNHRMRRSSNLRRLISRKQDSYNNPIDMRRKRSVSRLNQASIRWPISRKPDEYEDNYHMRRKRSASTRFQYASIRRTPDKDEIIEDPSNHHMRNKRSASRFNYASIRQAPDKDETVEIQDDYLSNYHIRNKRSALRFNYASIKQISDKDETVEDQDDYLSNHIRNKRSASRFNYASIRRPVSRTPDEEELVEDDEDDDDYIPHRPTNYHYDPESEKIVYDRKKDTTTEAPEYVEVEYEEIEEEKPIVTTTHRKIHHKDVLNEKNGPTLVDFLSKLRSHPEYIVIKDPEPVDKNMTTTTTMSPISTTPPAFLSFLDKLHKSEGYVQIDDEDEKISKKTTTTTTTTEAPEEEVALINVQNSPGGQFNSGGGFQLFDITEYIPKIKNYNPKTSIDYSKYKTIERTTSRHNLSSRYNEDEDDLPLDKNSTSQKPIFINEEESNYPEDDVITTTSTTTTTHKPQITKSRQRQRTRPTTTKRPTTTTVTEEPIYTPATHRPPSRVYQRKPRPKIRLRTTTPAIDESEEDVTHKSKRTQRKLETSSLPTNHKAFYSPIVVEDRIDVANPVYVQNNKRARLVTPDIISQTNKTRLYNYNKPQPDNHINPRKLDVEVFKDYDEKKKHGGNYVREGESAKLKDTAGALSENKEVDYDYNDEVRIVFGEGDKGKAAFIKDPSRRLYYYAPVD